MPPIRLADEYRQAGGRAAPARQPRWRSRPVLRLHDGAGRETWASPGADACRTILAEDQARLLHAAAELHEQACVVRAPGGRPRRHRRGRRQVTCPASAMTRRGWRRCAPGRSPPSSHSVPCRVTIQRRGTPMLAARVAREHLEETWLPLIDRIIASEAMVTWPRADLRGASGALRPAGTAMGEKLAELARDLIVGRDAADVVALTIMLRLAGAMGPAGEKRSSPPSAAVKPPGSSSSWAPTIRTPMWRRTGCWPRSHVTSWPGRPTPTRDPACRRPSRPIWWTASSGPRRSSVGTALGRFVPGRRRRVRGRLRRRAQ